MTNRAPRSALQALRRVRKVGLGAVVANASLVHEVRGGDEVRVVDNIAVDAFEALHAARASSAVLRAGQAGGVDGLSGKLRTTEVAAAGVARSEPEYEARLEVAALHAAAVESSLVIALTLWRTPLAETELSDIVSPCLLAITIFRVFRVFLVVLVSGIAGGDFLQNLVFEGAAVSHTNTLVEEVSG